MFTPKSYFKFIYFNILSFLQFPSVISTLSFKMGNWTYEVLNEFQFSTFSCLANSNGVGDEISANTTLIIERKLFDLF